MRSMRYQNFQEGRGMDMGNTKKKKKLAWQQYIGFGFMLLLGAVCGYIMGLFLGLSAEDEPLYQGVFALINIFLGTYIAMYFHIIIHETGHLLFGLMTGYTFSSFRIGSFMWLNENGKLKLKRLKIAGTSGQCLMIPPDLENGKIPLVLYNLGGSFINVAIGAIFLAGYFILPKIPFVSQLFFMLAIIGFMVAIMNGIPMRLGTIDNDGYNAFALSKNKEAVEAFWIQLKVNEQTSKGIRIKEMPAQWFEMPTDEAMQNSMVAARGVLVCNRLMDEEKFEDADILMAHLLEIDSGIVGLHRNLLHCDRIYVELIGENRMDVINNMMTKEQQKFMKSMKRFPSVLRTQYALALLFEENTTKAETIKHEFEKVAKTYPYPHEIDSERDFMEIANRKVVVKER